MNENKLILEEIIKLRKTVEVLEDRLNTHINFIDRIYDVLYSPMGYLLSKINYNKSLPESNSTRLLNK